MRKYLSFIRGGLGNEPGGVTVVKGRFFCSQIYRNLKLELFSIKCRKTKTKAIIVASYDRGR